MINKFKDFLRKLSRKRNSDSGDQEEFLDQVEMSSEPSIQMSDELINDESDAGESEEQVSDSLIADEDLTAEIKRPPETKPSWKDKLSASLPTLSKKTTDRDKSRAQQIKIPDKEILDQLGDDLEEYAGSTDYAGGNKSLKDRLLNGISGLRARIGSVNIREWKLPESMRNKQGDSILSLSPSLSKSIEKFLSRDARETIHQVSLIFIFCALNYTLGKLVALSMKGTPQVSSSRDYRVELRLDEDFNPQTLAQVRGINIFRTNTGLGSKKKVADTKCEEAQQESNLPIKLVNTVVLQDTVKSLASVQVRGDRQLQEVREGDQISNLAKIFRITRLEILVKNLENGVCESIASDKGSETRGAPISVMTPAQSKEFKASKKMPGIENEGNRFTISKALLDEKMKEIASILTQTRAIKIQNPDGTLAFKLTEMDPNGIFPYLGLQDQDIITSINGRPIYDLNDVMGLFSKIKNLDKLQLGVKREGSDSMLDYNIKK